MNPSDQYTPPPNPNPNPNPNQLHSLSAVRKRRRAGRRPNTTLFSSNQVYSSPAPQNFNNLNLSDEIIVINKDSTAEAMTALTVGFPADVLTEEEIEAGVVSVVGGIEQVNYILIRNHIITKWRENVTTWITKEMFFSVVPPHCSKLLDSAYEYLVSRGYINFGVAKEIKEKIPSEPNKSNIIIIGAGLAGLAAARQLMRFGFKVTILEGRKRAGGRVYTRKVEGGNKIAAADLGGSVLTGTFGNPLGILARQLSSSLHKVRDKCPLYRLDGKPVDLDIDLKVENAFNRVLDRASRLRQLMGEVSQDVSLGSALETFKQDYGGVVNAEELNLFNWHLANLEYANAGLLSKLSLAFWDQDDPYDMGGDHCFLPGGNGRLVQALSENIPILFEKTVNTVRYSGNGVQVVAGTQVFEGDMVLCTVPLGVLKSGSITFIPELPQRKLDGIKRLGFGLLNKVAMLFPDVFWGTDLDTFGHLTDDPSRRGEFFLFYSYATVAGGALLIALVAGEAAHTFESMPPTDAVTRVLQILRDIYEPQGITVPEPIQTVCTRWGSDPFSLGSYSNVAVGASGDDYDILAENVGDGRVFFAGEATNRRYPATMHGAFLSGLREAAHMARYFEIRTLGKKIEKKPSMNPFDQASILADLFRKPDIEFGSYAIIYDKKNTDPKSLAILRVTFSSQGKKNDEIDKPHSSKLLFKQLQSHINQKQEFHIYTLLPRKDAFQLWEVRGNDATRMAFLTENLGVKLIGRKGLGPMADSVISAIKAERGNRKSDSSSLPPKSGSSKPKSATSNQKLVRRAKIKRSKNGAGTSNIAREAKPVGTGVVAVTSLNQNVESLNLTDGNLDGDNSRICISDTAGGAKSIGTEVVSPSSLNQNMGVKNLIIENIDSGNISSLNQNVGDQMIIDRINNETDNLARISQTGDAVPLSSLNQNIGSVILTDNNFNGGKNEVNTLDLAGKDGACTFEAVEAEPVVNDVVSLSTLNKIAESAIFTDSYFDDGKNEDTTLNLAREAEPVGNDAASLFPPNQNLGSMNSVEGIFECDSYFPNIYVSDIFSGNSGCSNASVDIPLPNSYLGDSQMGEQPAEGADFSKRD